MSHLCRECGCERPVVEEGRCLACRVIHPDRPVNTVGYSTGAVVCPDYLCAMRHREARGERVAWFNTGDPQHAVPYFSRVGWMVARPEGFR